MFTVYSNADVPEFPNSIPHAARGFSLAPSTAAGTGVIPNGDYFIKNVNSNLYMDVKSAGTGSGTRVWQYSANGTNAQIFTVTYSNGSYSIKPKHVTNGYIDYETSTPTNGMAVVMKTATPSNLSTVSRRFNIVKSGSNYKIVSWNTSNKALRVQSNSKTGSAYIEMYDSSATSSTWQFVSASFATTPGIKTVQHTSYATPAVACTWM
jgi:hypothetical protein